MTGEPRGSQERRDSACEESLALSIEACMAYDRPGLMRRLRRLAARGLPDPVDLDRLREAVRASSARRARRAAGVPAPSLDASLPIFARQAEIASSIDAHQVTIVTGETGSGKTTQLPLICLAAGRGVAGLIGHTQPRRVAARAAAGQIARQLGSPLGRHVGFRTRFEERLDPGAYIALMTDGILLQGLHHDRWLRRYDTLIIDEAHERSLNIDLLLGYLKTVLSRRSDLKLLITSATLDASRLGRHFDDAPVLDVEGRSHPISVSYRPPPPGADLAGSILAAIEALPAPLRGGVLVFLPGEREIAEAARAIRRRFRHRWLVLPLYARMSARAQDRVFAASDKVKIVLATNVAETSITVPGISYVVDSGLARIGRYSYRDKLQSLPVEPVSRASADQRMGRCGRTGPGVCVRLYSEEDLQLRPEHTEPEIRRADLAAVILRMKSLGLGPTDTFAFVDPPDPRFVSDGLRTLRELGAIDEAGALTRLGGRLARLPVDPRLARMILRAGELGSLREVLAVTSALSVPEPFEPPGEGSRGPPRPPGKPRSDFMAYVSFWRALEGLGPRAATGRRRALCAEHAVAWPRLLEWMSVHRQLLRRCRELGLPLDPEPAGYDAVHRAIVSGCLGSIGRKQEQGGYAGPRGLEFRLSRSSMLQAREPPWVMAAELIQTGGVYAHRAARIRPEWVEECAPAHLLRRSYHSPYFDARRGRVYARETVSLYGLPVVGGRRVLFEDIDPCEARRVFVAEALVAGRIRTRGRFIAHNREVAARIGRLEDKARRTDILIDDAQMAALYQARVPPGIVSAQAFEGWRRRAEVEHPRLLCFSESELRRDGAAAVAPGDYPDWIDVGAYRLPLRYRFDPGSEDDGITVTVPVALLNQLSGDAFEWLVPGMLREKVIALLRTLPKSLRRSFVPVPARAEACLQRIAPGDGSLTASLERVLAELTGVRVSPSAWHPERLAPHLLMSFDLAGPDLATIARGRNLPALRRRFSALASAGFEAIRDRSLDRLAQTEWTFGELPARWQFDHGPMRLAGYPALVDEARGVSLVLADSPEKARRLSCGGLRRLARLRLARRLKALRRRIPQAERLGLLYSIVTDPAPRWLPAAQADPLGQIIEGALAECLVPDPLRIVCREAFDAWVEQGAARLDAVSAELSALASEILGRYQEVRRARRELGERGWSAHLEDVDDQLAHLVFQGFIAALPLARLREYPRYLEAVLVRLAKIERASIKDQRRMDQLAPLWEAYLEQVREASDPSRLEEVRWLIEELRVGLFAQGLGTREPISVQRIEAVWPASASG